MAGCAHIAAVRPPQQETFATGLRSTREHRFAGRASLLSTHDRDRAFIVRWAARIGRSIRSRLPEPIGDARVSGRMGDSGNETGNSTQRMSSPHGQARILHRPVITLHGAACRFAPRSPGFSLSLRGIEGAIGAAYELRRGFVCVVLRHTDGNGDVADGLLAVESFDAAAGDRHAQRLPGPPPRPAAFRAEAPRTPRRRILPPCPCPSRWPSGPDRWRAAPCRRTGARRHR